MKQIKLATGGRPRAFDREAALEIAMDLFCEHGYEGVAISDLTRAMGIAPTSLYAAFGSKEGLYRDALSLYLSRPDLPQLEPDGPVREHVTELLRNAVRAATDPNHPPGCMVMSGMLNCGAEHEALADMMAELRTKRCEIFAAYLAQGVQRGELPASTNTQALGRYLAALMQGIAIQARDGATPEELFALVDVAMASWPVV